MKSSTAAPEVVYVASNLHQAHLLAGALEREGIAAVVHNDALQLGIGGLPPGLDTAPLVVVERTDAVRARELALEFEAALRGARQDTGTQAWYQFSVRALIFLTVCVAVFLGVRQMAGGNTGAAMAALYMFLTVALFWAITRKLLRARS